MKIKKFTEECIRQNPLPKRKVLGLWSILLGCEDGPLIFLTISWGHKGWVLLAWGPQLCCFRQIRWPPWQAALWWPKLWIKVIRIRIPSELEFKVCVHSGWCIRFDAGLNNTNRHSSKSVEVTRLLFSQNDFPMGGSFWQKESLNCHTLFELGLVWYLAQSQIWCTTFYLFNFKI